MVAKTMVIREYGRAFQVSKTLIKDEPFPPWHEEPSPQMQVVLDMLEHDFQRTRVEHFPQWEEPPTLKEGPLFSILTIVRKDGEPVPDEVHDVWYAWYYWNEYDEDQPEEQPQFTYPEEYTTEARYFRVFAWYAQVPTYEEIESD